MSYRAFKRLLGETSLERKCRFLFGVGILLLITASFLWYAHNTEHLAYKQTSTTGRLLVNQTLARRHLEHVRPENWQWSQPAQAEGVSGGKAKKRLGARDWALLLRTFDDLSEEDLEALKRYQHRIIKPKAVNRENMTDNSYEQELLKAFQADDDLNEQSGPVTAERVIHYYGAVRATRECRACHPRNAEEREAYGDPIRDQTLMAVVKIGIPTDGIEKAVHWNRAVLISTALVTALLIMGGSYVIVRYVIVKPVKHLKEVSDAIAAGELNVRSEIQTGDEFEDLSHAFNRMLRNLVSMQDRWRKVNADLDRKVDELAQANMALYESNRLKSDFMATMSHELRTPLNSILGFSEVLLSSNPLTDKQQRWSRNIQTSGERLLNLINDILDLAKIEAGKMQVRLEEFSIHEVCEGQLNMFRPLAEKKNIDLRGQIDPAIPLLRQDVVKLQQILSNLLSNAIKFTPEGGRVLLKAEVDMRHVVLTVSDTGVGIAPEEQELVFEKFRQSGNPLTREHAGTGLGLSIVRELSKLLGGEVSLQSELGRGSTFTVRLSLQLSAEPRLEFDLADERVDLSKAQRVDLRLYAGTPAPGPAAPDGPADGTAMPGTAPPDGSAGPLAVKPSAAPYPHSG
ncbi:MAG TPA: ATP-binding protein [Gemmataceae bacterium]|nr:ATP-binding protein [Gemmataceae bacterium]